MFIPKLYFVLFSIIFLTACTDRAIVTGFNDNIHKIDDFENYLEDNNYNIVISEDNKTYQNCQQATIRSKEIKVQALAELLSRVYNINIQVEQALDKNNVYITMNLQNVCLEQVLDYLIQAYNIGNKTSSYGYVLISPRIQTKVFKLDYHNFNRNSASSISISSSDLNNNGGQQAVGNAGNNSAGASLGSYSAINSVYSENFWDNIEKTLNMIVADGNNQNFNIPACGVSNQISLHRNTGMIVVKAYPSTLLLVEEFLNHVNANSLKQVVIEAKILEITLNDEFVNGIQWELLKKKLYMTSFTNGNVKPDINKVFKDINLVSENLPISTLISGKITNGSDFAGVIQALSTQGKVSILSSPRVSTLNNQRALIKYGDEQFYLTNITNTTLGNNGTTTQDTNAIQTGFTLTPFFSGIALDATPNILNNKQILLHIHPIVTRVTSVRQNVF